eukprot:COSAG01_NODE_15911_length_1286_cov_2.206403_1_plen_144_part_10
MKQLLLASPSSCLPRPAACPRGYHPLFYLWPHGKAPRATAAAAAVALAPARGMTEPKSEQEYFVPFEDRCRPPSLTQRPGKLRWLLCSFGTTAPSYPVRPGPCGLSRPPTASPCPALAPPLDAVHRVYLLELLRVQVRVQRDWG